VGCPGCAWWGVLGAHGGVSWVRMVGVSWVRMVGCPGCAWWCVLGAHGGVSWVRMVVCPGCAWWCVLGAHGGVSWVRMVGCPGCAWWGVPGCAWWCVLGAHGGVSRVRMVGCPGCAWWGVRWKSCTAWTWHRCARSCEGMPLSWASLRRPLRMPRMSPEVGDYNICSVHTQCLNFTHTSGRMYFQDESARINTQDKLVHAFACI